MPWVTRGSRRYYVRNTRVGNRVETRYMGGGVLGLLCAKHDAISREIRQVRRAEARNEAEALMFDDREAAELLDCLGRAVDTALEGAGLRRHGRHSRWRRRRTTMTDTATAPVTATATGIATTSTVHETTRALVERADAKDKTVKQPLLRHFIKHPGEAECYLPSVVVELGLLQSIDKACQGNVTVSRAAEVKMRNLAKELAGERPSPIERLLADRVALSWLTLHTYEVVYEFTQSPGGRVEAAHQRRITAASRRYLAALRALAAVRKVPRAILAAVQVNVGTIEEGRGAQTALTE